MMGRLRPRVASLFRRERYERDLDSELRFHLDMLTDHNVRAGMPPGDARRAALHAFGQMDRVKDDVRDTWLSRSAETLGQDLRYGVRGLARSPGFALVVIFTMALGIGANTAIFSVVNGVLLEPLPYEGGERLVVLRQQHAFAGAPGMNFSYPEILDYRTAASLEAVVEFHNMWFILLGRSEPERVSTGVVSATFFDVLGVRPLYGRTLQAADDRPGAPAVLLLSHVYWQRSFGGDPSIVGRVFQMNDRPHQVVGVLPPIPYPNDVDVYMPTSACPFRSNPAAAASRDYRAMTAIARVRERVTLRKAQADLDIVSARLQQEHPDFYPAGRGYRTVATPLHEELTASFRTTAFVLLGTAGFVLLIVCASIANLMLARMVRRAREMAVRAALGASRRRLLWQLLTESTLLALLGGLAGLAVGAWGLDLLVAYAERFTPRASEIRIDRTVLLYTLGLSIATGLIFGSIPAWGGRLAGLATLREWGRATERHPGLPSALIVVQVAASFMLLIGAGLMVRSLLKLQQVNPGIRTDNVLTMRIDLNFTKYPSGRRAAFWQRIEAQMKDVPGVAWVGGAGTFPLNELGPFSSSLVLADRALPPGGLRPRVDVRLATPDYFSALGQPLLAGRPFRDSDRAGTHSVAIVNETMARHYWPGGTPLGARISGNDGKNWIAVVGVVADARQHLSEEPADEVYLPMFQNEQLSTTWLVRSDTDPGVMIPRIRAAVRAVDAHQPVDHFRTLSDVRAASLAPCRLTVTLLALFGLLALVITAAGIAGVVAFSVNQRMHEFGVRLALGARRTKVLSMVVMQGLRLVLIGLAIGSAGALVLARVLATMLFGVQPTDGITFVAVAMVLTAVAALACLLPARRAASVDPMVALER